MSLDTPTSTPTRTTEGTMRPMKKHPDQITLGDLIAILQRRPAEEPVVFDFCGVVPDGVDSYRGYYEDLALGWSEEGHCTVALLLEQLRGAVGEVFTGRKGGEYRMTAETPLWVDRRSDASGTLVVGVAPLEGRTVLLTRWCIDV